MMTAGQWVSEKWGERAAAALEAAREFCYVTKTPLETFTLEWLDSEGTRHLCRGIRDPEERIDGPYPEGAKWMVDGGEWQGPGALPKGGSVNSAGPWTREYLLWVEYTRTEEYALSRKWREKEAARHSKTHRK